MKKILLVLLLFIAFNAQAQTKYEYAVLTICPEFKEMQIAITGKDFKKLQISKDQVQASGDVTIALQEIDKMQESGWELMNSEASPTETYHIKVYTFFLRRKKA